MNWIGNRISFIDSKGKTTIVILPEKNFLVSAVMGGWLAMWLTIGITVIWSLVSFSLTKQEEIIVYIFLVFWFYYALKVSKSFLWLLYGKELIKMDKVALHYKKSLVNYGKTTPYYYENLRGFTYQIPDSGSFQAIWEKSPWISGSERFHFEYFTKIVHFGRKIPEKEAKLLFQLLNKRIQDYSKK